MKRIFVLATLFLSLKGFSQHYIQASIQQGTLPNSVNVVFLPNYTTVTGEYANYLSISIAIPTASAAGVTPSLSMTGPFAGITMAVANPFTYTDGTQTIWSWIYSSGSSPMSWTAGSAFTGAVITFDGGIGAANVSLVDFTNHPMSGGLNSNTYYLIVTNIPPFDVANYSNLFYSIPGPNGSTVGTYANGDQYVQTGVPINLSSVCPAPATPTVVSTTVTNASFSWTAVSGVVGYEVAVSLSSSTPSSGIPGTSPLTLPDTLKAGTQYYFFVRSKCGVNNYSIWSMVPFTTICPVITGLTVGNISTTSADINWTGVTGVLGYNYAITINLTPPNTTPPIAFTATPAVPGPLTLSPGTQYYVHVRTNCSPGVYSVWTTQSFTTAYPPCIEPSSLSVSNTGSNATITWPAVTGASGYEYAIITSPTAPGSGTATNNTNFQAQGLGSNTQYFVYVRTNCGAGGFSPWKTISFTTACFKPVPFVIGNSVITGTADLGWYSIKGAQKYEYAILSNAASPGGSLNFTEDTILHAADLTPGSKYYLHIRTHCGPTSISEWSVLEFYTSGVAIFPNPVNDVLTITIYGAEAQNQELALFDAVGRLLQKIKLTGATTTINMAGYAPGMYFVRFGKNKDYIKRILKIK